MPVKSEMSATHLHGERLLAFQIAKVRDRESAYSFCSGLYHYLLTALSFPLAWPFPEVMGPNPASRGGPQDPRRKLLTGRSWILR